jgi:hypothetical protein
VNAKVSKLYQSAFIECNSRDDTTHVVNITPDLLAQTTHYTLSGCNFQAKWIVNIIGTGDITLQGDTFPANPGAVVYNIIGSGRTLTLTTSFGGSILAPNNNIFQQQGVVIGKVIAGNVPLIHQVNLVHCPKPDPITLLTYTDGPVKAGAASAKLIGDGGFIVGDVLNFGGEDVNVTKIDYNNKLFFFATALQNDHGAGTEVSTVVEDPSYARKAVIPPEPTQNEMSSDSAATGLVASSVAVLVAVFAALL